MPPSDVSGAPVRFLLPVVLGLAVSAPATGLAESPAGSGAFRASDGAALRYVSAGSGPPLVLVPGWTMPGRVFAAQVRAFSGRYRLISFDPRWHGESERPGGPVSLGRLGDDLADLINALRLPPPVLLGWSLGADEVLAYLRAHGTGEVRGLVLVDEPLSPFTPARAAARRRFLDRFRRDRPDETERFVRGMFRKPHPEGFYDGLARDAERVPLPVALALLDPGAAEPVPWDALRNLKGRVLDVAATVAAGETDLLRRELPDARIVSLAPAGHAVFADEPDRFDAVLGRFLETLR